MHLLHRINALSVWFLWELCLVLQNKKYTFSIVKSMVLFLVCERKSRFRSEYLKSESASGFRNLDGFAVEFFVD